ncbi:unnamed protein product [Phyllotreta striolata]|uniref:Neuromodulin n=1 Tax=Phyllotreta striolata TaxID=444603 RepID=A0A9N9TTG9_PHYSR|nr:unnamed protein product [Phyllotreta striolata]
MAGDISRELFIPFFLLSQDDNVKELCHAATKIQASFRGHMTRKQGKKNDEESGTSQGKGRDEEEEEEVDIDLTDPELNKAAVKIQASFRGHMTRKDGNKPEDE